MTTTLPAGTSGPAGSVMMRPNECPVPYQCITVILIASVCPVAVRSRQE